MAMPSTTTSNAVKPMPAGGASYGMASLIAAFVVGALIGGGAMWYLRSPKAPAAVGGATNVNGAQNTDGAPQAAEAIPTDASIYGTVTAVKAASFTMSVSAAKSDAGSATREVLVDESTVISSAVLNAGTVDKNAKATTAANSDTKVLALSDLQEGMQVVVVTSAEDGAKDTFTAKQVHVTSQLHGAVTLPPPPPPQGEPLTPPSAGSGSAEPIKPPTAPSAGTGTTAPTPPKK